MTTPTPIKFPKTEEALKAYGDNLYAQARGIGIHYNTLREWLISGNLPSNLIQLACKQDIYRALGEDIADQADLLCPPDEGHDPVTPA